MYIRLGDLSFGIVKSCKGIDKFQCDYRSFPNVQFSLSNRSSLIFINPMVYNICDCIEQTYHWQLWGLMDRCSEQWTWKSKSPFFLSYCRRNLVRHGEMLSGLVHTRGKAGAKVDLTKNKDKRKTRQTSKGIFAFASALTQTFACCKWALRMFKSVMEPGFPREGVSTWKWEGVANPISQPFYPQKLHETWRESDRQVCGQNFTM